MQLSCFLQCIQCLLGLSKSATPERFTRWRTVELKHGRVAMAAVSGYLVQEFVRWPGYIAPGLGLKFADVPNGVAAIGAIPFLGWAQIILFVGWLETILKQEEDAEPGTFGTGYFTEYGRVGALEGDKKAEKLTKELQNGRLAMLGIMELLTHDVAKPAGDSLFTLHHF
jgi:light-harvesting complex I chlorophyll a/b binding protein 1